MTGICKVLIVDDCEEDRQAYRRYLQRHNALSSWEFKVKDLETAEAAIAMLRDESFDVVLLDYDLPELSGLDFLSWSQKAGFKSTAIIMLSAHGNEALAVQALKQGAQDYLVKQSVTDEVLFHTIRASLEQVRLRQELQQAQDQQRLVSNIALRIRNSLDLSQILETSVQEIQALSSCDRVLVFQLSDGGPRVAAQACTPGIAPVDIDATNPLIFTPWNQKALRQSELAPLQIGSPTTITDPAQQDALALLQLKSWVEVPIWIEPQEGNRAKLWGFLVLHHCQASPAWFEAKEEALQELCVHLAIAIQQSELLTQTQCALIKEQELNEFKSQIVATVSHEYRTPITSILASATTLDRHAEKLDPDQSQRLLQLIAQQARHLKELVHDMLVVNQVELGQIRFSPFPLNLEQFFRQLLEEYQVMTQPGQKLSLEIQGNCDFKGDFGLCKQIFSNLLSNAIKYSPEGGPISILVSDDQDSVTVRMKDYGIGIPATEIGQMFQSFTRGSNVDTITGTGLGLSIARACVDRHQGSISMQSVLNQYTEVVVTFPKVPEQFGN